MKQKPTANLYEKWVRKKQHMPVERFTHKGFDVYISEGGPYFEATKIKEYPLGWYESCYAVGKDGVIQFIRPLEFTSTHDLNSSNESRREGRINAARVNARKDIDEMVEILAGRDTIENVDGTVEKVYGKANH